MVLRIPGIPVTITLGAATDPEQLIRRVTEQEAVVAQLLTAVETHAETLAVHGQLLLTKAVSSPNSPRGQRARI